MIKLRKILLYNSLYYVVITVTLIYCVFIIIQEKESIYLNEKFLVGIIEKYNIEGNKLKLEVKAKEKVSVLYFFETEKEKNIFSKKYKIGSKVFIAGKFNLPATNTTFNLFNYKKFLLSKKIKVINNAEEIVLIPSNIKLKYKIKDLLIKRINNLKYNQNYLFAFILGETSFFKKVTFNSYQTNGISHLFAISGMHVSLLTGVFLYFLTKLKIYETKRYGLSFLVVLFYMFLTNYSASIMRAGLFFIILSINKIKYLNIKTINILLVTVALNMLINPYIIYSVGFQFSAIISFFLILSQEQIKKQKGYFRKTFIVSCIAFLSSIPIMAYNFFEINLLSPIINLVFVPLISLLIFPISIISIVITPLGYILNPLILFAETISIKIASFSLFQITISKPSFLVFILLYVLLFIFIVFKKKACVIIFILIIIFLNQKINFVKNPIIYFLDVGQGDSALIVLPKNKGIILVDTGGKIYFKEEEWKSYERSSLSDQVTIPFLKSIGVKKIDYLLLTHGDADHLAEAENIINNISVDKIIMNMGEFSYLEKRINNLYKKKVLIYKAGDKISINNFEFDIISPSVDIDENENSLVMYFLLNNYKVLLTGDAGMKSEKIMLDKYQLPNIDILKVGHHGSKGSSCKCFIETILPKYAIISASNTNKFGHPHKETIDILNKVKTKIYFTSNSGTIKVIFDKQKIIIKETN